MSYKKVEFELIDIQSVDFSLMEIEDLNKIVPAKMKIIGYLIKENTENYFLAKEIWETGQFKYVHIIPQKYVIKKRYLK